MVCACLTDFSLSLNHCRHLWCLLVYPINFMRVWMRRLSTGTDTDQSTVKPVPTSSSDRKCYKLKREVPLTKCRCFLQCLLAGSHFRVCVWRLRPLPLGQRVLSEDPFLEGQTQTCLPSNLMATWYNLVLSVLSGCITALLLALLAAFLIIC